MDFKIRNINLEKDYSIILKWWEWFRFSAVPQDFLPKTGLMVSLDSVDIVAGFVYQTNSKVAWIEFITSNPNVKDKKVRKEAIQHIITMLTLYAKRFGAKYIYTSLKHQSLINHFDECGFVKGSKDCLEMVKVI